MINKFSYFGCTFETSRGTNLKHKKIFAPLRAIVFELRHNFAVKNFQVSNVEVTINKNRKLRKF